MKKAILFFFKYYLFWFLFFISFKFLFLLSNYKETLLMGWGDFLKVFSHGSLMDFSVAGYLTIIPGVLLSFTSFINPKFIDKIIRWYTHVFLVVVTLTGLVDIGLYPFWRTRLGAQIIPYLSNPSGIMACVNIWQVILLTVSLIVIAGGIILIYKKIFPKKAFHQIQVKWYTSPVMLVLTAALILPIRGGTNTSPLNFSSVCFSSNLYSNQSAYNFFWSFGHSVTHNKLKVNPFHYYSDEECEKNLEGIYLLNQEKLPVYIKTGNPVNVILIILESFSNKIVGSLGGVPGLTPCIDQLGKEGIVFSSFYATGNRSDKGISSLIATYPALCKASSIIGYPDKMDDLDYLPLYFKKHNYTFSFYYGGDINFYNTRMVLINAGADRIISSSDFPAKIASMQNWGVPDEYLFQKMSEDLSQSKQPFFNILYTLSSHEPFDIPGYSKIEGNSTDSKYFNSICYTDSCLGAFISDLKTSNLWENTLIVITSDHGSPFPGLTMYDDPVTYRIPMVWAGGVIDTSFVSDNIAMQTDLNSTLIQQLGWDPSPSYFSKNIFGYRHYAFYYRDKGWGFISPQTNFFMNIENGKQKFYYGEDCTLKDSLDCFSKSFTQFLHYDFFRR